MSCAIEQRPHVSLVSPGDVNNQHTYRQKYTIFKHTPRGCVSLADSTLIKSTC